MLFIRCRESVALDIFNLVEAQLKDLSGDSVKCEIIDLIPLNYTLTSYHKHIFDKEGVCYAEKVLRTMRPDVVVSGNDVAISATFIKVCNLFGIPSVVIQHGILAERKNRSILSFLQIKNYLPWRIISSIANIPVISKCTLYIGWRTRVLDWGLGGATKYSVMGDYQKRRLISQGVSPNRIVVTGYPLFDMVPTRMATFDRKTTFNKLGINEDNYLVLFLSQCFVEDGVWNPKQRTSLTQAVIESTKKIGLQLIIKVHPRESIKDYENLSESSEKVIVLKNFDLHELLLACDVAVTVSSTTAFWALAYEKPLITVTCFPSMHENIFETVSFNVKSLADLPKTLEMVVEKNYDRQSFLEKKKMFVQNYSYKLDARASKRIAKVILSLVKKDR